MVENWKEAWKWFSVQVLAVLAVMPQVWMQLPDDVKDFIPEEWRPIALSLVAFGGIVLRLRDQKRV